MNSRVLLLAAALALACLALSAQARDLQQVGDDAEALIAAQVAAQVGRRGRRCGWARRRQTGGPAHAAHLGCRLACPAAAWAAIAQHAGAAGPPAAARGTVPHPTAAAAPPPPLSPQEEKIKNYREFEQDHNNQQEDLAASGGSGRRGKKGRRNNNNDDGTADYSGGSAGGSDGGSEGGDAYNPYFGRDPSGLSKAEKRKARREAKKLGMSLDEYLGWQGGSSTYDGSEEEAPRKKGKKGRRSGPTDDLSTSGALGGWRRMCCCCWLECSGGWARCWDHMLPLTRHVPVGPASLQMSP